MGKGSLGWQPSGNPVPGGRIRSSSVIAAVLGALSSVATLAGTASAHAAGSAHPGEWDQLLLILIVMGAIVAALVYSVMVLALWRYRENSPYVRKEPSTHNFKLEAVWTIIPLIVVTVVVILSLQVLSTTEDLPEDGITIEVIARQFEWTFVYPDNTTTKNEIWVEEGQTVIFKIWSEDVIHSFSLPEFRLKVDAFPNYVDDAYIIAEPAGEYNIFCAEFCGDIHSSMIGTLHIYPKGVNDKPWGPPPGEVPPPPDQEKITIDLELRESGGPGPEAPWSITPSLVELPFDAEVTFRVWNNGTEAHSFVMRPPYTGRAFDIPPGEYRYLNFTSDKPTAGVAGYCPDRDHEDQGLSTTIMVEPDPGGGGTDADDIDFPYAPALYGLALGILGVAMVAAIRTPKKEVHEDHLLPESTDEHDYHVPGEDAEGGVKEGKDKDDKGDEGT